MSKKFEEKKFIPFNEAALRNENERIARGGCHAPWQPGDKTVDEILDNLKRERSALANIYCPGDKSTKQGG